MAHLMSLIPSLGALRSDWFMSPAAILDVCRLHKYIYIYIHITSISLLSHVITTILPLFYQRSLPSFPSFLS